MIKFFRQIRQSLIMTNQTGKYIKYAIGEIVLVVVGILIALQINNWNEAQKLNGQLNQYKANLIAELEKDLREIDSLNNFRLECKNSVMNYVKYYDKEDMIIDSLIAKRKAMKPVVRPFNKSSYTLQELSNTGNISLFNNEQKLAIVQLKNLQDKSEFMETSTIDICIRSYEQLAQNSDILYEENFSSKEHPEVRGWRFNPDTKQHRLLHNHLTDLLSLYKIQDEVIYPQLRAATVHLLAKLKEK